MLFQRSMWPAVRGIPLSRMSSTRSSPYVVLGIGPSSTVDQIKSAFRKLAKQHHPDLNPNVPDTRMSEILAAYEAIMTGNTTTLASAAADSRVAFACEVMTLEQLRLTHDVRTIRILFDKDYQMNHNHDHDDTHDIDTVQKSAELSNTIIYPLTTHIDDSVSDFKHILELHFAQDWGLDQHRTDRYGLRSGWELVQDGEPLQLLGNHFFLHSYGIAHGDLVHAIIRR